MMSAPATILLLLQRVDCNDGVASYLETLVSALAARGDRLIMVSGPVSTLYGSTTRRNAIRAGLLDWHVIDDLQISMPIPTQLRQILSVIRQHDVSVLGPQGLAILPYAWLISRLSGKKIVINYHPSVHGKVARDIPLRRSWKARLAYRVVCNIFSATRFIASSKEIQTFYRLDCGIPARRIHYQVFGIDSVTYRAPSDQEREESRVAMDITPNTLVCVLSGRLNLVKGHDVAVDAIRSLRHARPDLLIRCFFAGAGDQKDEIESYALRNDFDRKTFIFLGFINNSKRLRDIYWAADILLLPSRFEGFGLVVPEAMCCGAVPIRTPSGGWQDQVVDGENGFIVPFNDAPALAERIVRLSTPGRLSEMRRCAISFASVKFAKSAMADGTSELYRGVSSGKII